MIRKESVMSDGRDGTALITIRDAQVHDASAMGHFMVSTWLTAHRDHIPPAAWQRRQATWTAEVSAAGWRRHLIERDAHPENTRAWYLLAENPEKTTVGLVAAAVTDDDPSGTVAEVGSLYIHTAYQRRGIGRRLLQHLAVQLRRAGVDTLHIGVVETNIEAHRFYERVGGQRMGDRIFDEDGDLLPERIYSWPDLTTMLPAASSDAN